MQSLPYTTEVNINFNRLRSSTLTDGTARKPPQRSNSMPVTRSDGQRHRVVPSRRRERDSVMNSTSPQDSPVTRRTQREKDKGENSRKSGTRERKRGAGRCMRLRSANADLDMGSAQSSSPGADDHENRADKAPEAVIPMKDVVPLSEPAPEVSRSPPDLIFEPDDIGSVEFDPGFSDDELWAKLKQQDVKKVLEALGVPDDSIADDYKDLSSGSDSLFTDAELSHMDNDNDLRSLEEELGNDLIHEVLLPHDGQPMSPEGIHMVNGIVDDCSEESSDMSKALPRLPSHSSSDSALGGVATESINSASPPNSDSPEGQVLLCVHGTCSVDSLKACIGLELTWTD